MNILTPLRRRAGTVHLLCVLTAGSWLSCAIETRDPTVARAEAVYREVMSRDPQYAAYGVSVAARSTAPMADELVLSQISSLNYQVAVEAARALASRPNKEAAEALRGAFSTKGGILRLEAAIALAELGDADAMRWLEQNAVQPSGAPNARVVVYLSEKGREEIVRPALDQRIKAQEQASRDEVYALLGGIPGPWAVELLQKGLKKEFGEARKEAIVALGRAGDAEAAKQILPFTNTKGLVFASIEALGNLGNEAALPALEKALKNPDKLVRVYAGAALWKLGKGTMVEPVIGPLTRDEDPVVRVNLAEQLSGVAADDVLPMLAALSDDEDPKVRVAAVRALRERKEPGLEQIFLDRIQDPEYQAAVLALDALGGVGSDQAVESLVPLLDSENGYVAISAANAILEIKARQEKRETQPGH